MGDFALPLRSPLELPAGERLSSDERLARLASKGSERAFAALYRRHHQALYRYCRSIVRNEDDAQDALQSTMTRALVALRASDRDLAVRPWLFRIAHNEAVSLLRRRRPNASLAEGLEPGDGGLERTVEQRERFAALRRDLQCLAVRQRAALVMRELSGLSIEEIAAALSTSPGAAKQAVFEARCALQEFEQGRAMECEAVRRAISDGDGRVMRARKLRAHLRDCASCRDFQAMIGARTAELSALAPPLPAAAAGATLARVLGTGGAGGGHAAGMASASGAAIGHHAAASLTMKVLAGVAVVTAATAGTVHLTSTPHRHHVAPTPARRGVHASPVAGVGAAGDAAVGAATAAPARSGAKALPPASGGASASGAETALGAAAPALPTGHGEGVRVRAPRGSRAQHGGGRSHAQRAHRTGQRRNSPEKGQPPPRRGEGRKGSANGGTAQGEHTAGPQAHEPHPEASTGNEGNHPSLSEAAPAR